MKLKLLGIVFLGCVFTGNLLSMVDTGQLEQQCHEDYVAAKNNLKKTIDADYAKYHRAQMKSQSALQELYKNYQITKKEASKKNLRQLAAIGPKPLSKEQKKIEKIINHNYVSALGKLETKYTDNRNQLMSQIELTNVFGSTKSEYEYLKYENLQYTLDHCMLNAKSAWWTKPSVSPHFWTLLPPRLEQRAPTANKS